MKTYGYVWLCAGCLIDVRSFHENSVDCEDEDGGEWTSCAEGHLFGFPQYRSKKDARRAALQAKRKHRREVGWPAARLLAECGKVTPTDFLLHLWSVDA